MHPHCKQCGCIVHVLIRMWNTIKLSDFIVNKLLNMQLSVMFMFACACVLFILTRAHSFLEKERQHVMVAAVKDHTHLTSFVPAVLLRSAMRNRTVASCRMYKPNHTRGVSNHISQDAKICLFIYDKFCDFIDTLSARQYKYDPYSFLLRA